jgi:hypothetical protein
MRRLGWFAWILVLLVVLGPAAPAAIAATFGIENLDVTFSGPEGEEATQAGSHPYAMTTSFTVNVAEGEEGRITLVEPPKDLEITQIPGFVGNPNAVPPCSSADFLTPRQNLEPNLTNSCPDTSAVGLVGVETITSENERQKIWSPVYNLKAPPGSASELGFWTQNVPVTLTVGVNESPPYNLIAHTQNISQLIEVTGAQFTLWGNPVDPSHDTQRGLCLGGKGPAPISFGSCPAKIANKPFLTLPRACNGPLETSYEADSWEHPGIFSSVGSVLTHDSSEPPLPLGMTGCGKVDFGPEVTITPGTSQAESASGLDLEITSKDEGLSNPEGIAAADIEATEFALPAGMTLNPSAAEGLGVCSEAQFEAESLAQHGCPEASKLGSLEVETPVLENTTLRGAVYLAAENENPFGSLFAAYLVIRNPELGIFVKLPAEIETDETTGQVVTFVEEMPQFPLSRIRVRLRSGPRAPLVTPPACGTYATEAVLTPSSGGAPLEQEPSFTISSGPGGSPCPSSLPFAPAFEAGAQSNAAGAYSPFSMRITRQDGEQDITRFSATLPPGEVAKIAGVPECPDSAIEAARAKSGRAELASPSCPAETQIGTVIAGAGVGTALTYVPGSLYLAGPFHGDQLSVVAIVPAVAGPFDVGTVVTRVALALNPETGEAEVDGSASEPIPHILKGVPLKLRDLRVFASRPEFTLNPTSCRTFYTRAQISGSGANPFTSADDTLAAAAARYQAASCASLRFAPKLALRMKGGTRRGDHPSLHSLVTYPKGAGYANIGRAVVVLPHSEFIDPESEKTGHPCTLPQFAEGACPPLSRLGFARAYTPLLEQPLEGPVYFRSNHGARVLPDIVADLGGQFHVVLVGAVDSIGPSNSARLRTTFAQVPDAPVSKFELTLTGGKEGVLENSANLCANKRYAQVKLRAQNGKLSEERTPLKVTCRKKKK